jgi:hypothetical protein
MTYHEDTTRGDPYVIIHMDETTVSRSRVSKRQNPKSSLDFIKNYKVKKCKRLIKRTVHTLRSISNGMSEMNEIINKL